MIKFTCEKAALLVLLGEMRGRLEIVEAGRPNYFKIMRNGRLIGYWNDIDRYGEFMISLLRQP